MSLDERLRSGLEGLDAIETIPPDDVVASVVGRGGRRRWARRIAAAGVALAAAIGGLLIVPRALDLGKGEPRPAQPHGTGTITTVAGDGTARSSGDGGPATEASIAVPSVIGFDRQGNLYLTDSDIRVRKIDPSGIITTVVGPPAGGVSVEGDASRVLGHGRAVDRTGNLYVAGLAPGSTDEALLKVTPTGDVTVIAGTGHAGCSGDGGPATQAQLNLDYAGVTVDTAGNIYITQYHDNCVLRIDTKGTITTIAGTGDRGFTGDGGPALEARLNGPTTVSLDGQGNIYIADQRNHRIRRIDPRGFITTVAGNGEKGFPDDGAVATEVPIGGAEVRADPDGNIYITDERYPGIFKVDTEGILTILAGTGVDGDSGDGGPATEARMSEPSTVAIGPDGDLYIADWGNYRIRKVDL